MPENKIICGDWIEVAETLPSGIAHLIITSPPFWGQRLYGWGGDGSCEEKKKPHIWLIDEPIQICQNCGMKAPTLGLEKTPEEHIEKLVVGFRELRRVLRDDGCVFLNYGDKYANTGKGSLEGQDKSGLTSTQTQENSICGFSSLSQGLKQGDLIGLAWRLALALQADGWYLRSDIIWAKALSFCEKYSGSTMPESMKGWRWERHKIKVKAGGTSGDAMLNNRMAQSCGRIGTDFPVAQWKPCPGCPKCEPNDGLVLRKGSGRPTRAHEYLFLLAKTSNYFYDTEAVREEYNYDGRHDTKLKPTEKYGSRNYGQNPNTCHAEGAERWPSSGRNLRDVWCINPQAYPGAHYATFPERLVEPCIKVGTSEKGCCPKCGAPWARIVDINGGTIGKSWHNHSDDIGIGQTQCQHPGGVGVKQAKDGNPYNRTTLGWRPTCQCDDRKNPVVWKYKPVPCTVYEPFMGSGTVPAVAAKLGRNYICSELNEDYIKNQAEYRVAEGETGISKEWQKAGQKTLFK